MAIQPEGNYIVLNDLDFRGVKASQTYFFPRGKFQGYINFNGHTVYKTYFYGSNKPLFEVIGENGKIENLVLKLYFPEELAASGQSLFFHNYGNISNLYVSVEECTKGENDGISILGSTNIGTISDFIINYKESLYGINLKAIINNQGEIKNGYIYGQNLQLFDYYNNNSNSVFVINNTGIINNMYSLTGIDANEIRSQDTTSLVVVNNSGGEINNIYTVGIGSTYNISYSPNTYSGVGRISNSFYINDKIFKGTADKKVTNKVLYDVNFQNKVLNGDESFEIEKLIQSGYYPQLKLNECMPRQDYIELPEMTDADLPDILSAEILEAQNKSAKVKINVYNPAGETIEKIIVKNLTTSIISQNYSGGKSEVIVELTNPIECVSSYAILSLTTKGAYNIAYTKNYNEGEQNIDISFYNEIYTVDDWYNIKKFGDQNYRLMNDLDFINADENKYAGINFYGELDGQGHTIKNIYINTKAGLFYTVNSTTYIVNLNIKNCNIKSNSTNVGICTSGNINVKNVNIDTLNIESKGRYIGGFVSVNCNSGKFENVTMNNINILCENTSNLNVGVVLGNGSADMSNIYINNFNIKAKQNINVIGIGGIIGSSTSYRYTLKNIIIKGNINTDSGYVGGIAGSGYLYLENTLIDVDINSNGDYVGGIIGKDSDSSQYYKNNLYIGNIVNKKETKYVNYVSGRLFSGTNNYISDTSVVNGKLEESINRISINELKDKLTYQNKLKWDDNYSYEDLENKLPKIKNVEKTELLPNQQDIYLLNSDINLNEVATLKQDSNTLEIRLNIENPKEHEITVVEIEDMKLEITENRTQEGITYVKIIAKPTKYYDSYQITNIKYLENNEEKNAKQYYLITEAFYKEITKYEDWQNIEPNSYENYRLLTDLDFLGKSNVNHNLKIGKLVTEGNKHTIKNINIAVEDSYYGLIKECKNGLENIIFENIGINYDQSKSITYVGVIAQNNGYIKNVDFKNINIETKATNKVSYVGCIGGSTGYPIENINLQSIKIDGVYTDVGGLFGNTTSGNLNNIIADDVNINAIGNRIGGIVGSANVSDEDNFENIKLTNSNICGNNTVGGVIGNGYVTKNVSVENCQIAGASTVGGVLGTSNYYSDGIQYIYVKGSNIVGEENVGGIIGTSGMLYDSEVLNSTISGPKESSKNIGGIIGKGIWSLQRSSVRNSKVISAGSSVGGLFGEGLACTKCYAINNIIEGYSNVGGITGTAISGTMNYTYSNSEVIATEHSAGGIVGYLDNSHMSTVANRSYISGNYYAGNTIKAKANVGGIIGRIGKELDEFEQFYKSNYSEANLISNDNSSISLGIGSNPEENVKFKATYYYKYSSLNGKNPNEANEQYIAEVNYLTEEDLKKNETYTSKLAWGKNFDYEILAQNKYPIILYNSQSLPNQDGIDIPVDVEHIIENTENSEEVQNKILEEQVEQTFEYENKEIKTYSTFSTITAKDGSDIIRNVKLYIKDNNLYAIPNVLSAKNSEMDTESLLDAKIEEVKNISNIVPVKNNLILDKYNGKEYETVLGSDGKIYDLKEAITYPENFVNEDIASIGNNLNDNSHEIEVTYKNGDKIKFNYQTGEVISSSEAEVEEKTGLFDYLKEKISEIGNSNSEVLQEIKTKYEESKELQTKLEETSVEEAIKKHNNSTQIENSVTITEDNLANSSLKEKKYISIYNEGTGEYEIYNEEELLDTNKEEVVSENEKIKTNNLSEYYAS